MGRPTSAAPHGFIGTSERASVIPARKKSAQRCIPITGSRLVRMRVCCLRSQWSIRPLRHLLRKRRMHDALAIKEALSRRLRLDAIAEGTLGIKKIGRGLQAQTWWREGNILKTTRLLPKRRGDYQAHPRSCAHARLSFLQRT